jgi:recombination protein RecA
MSSLPWNAGENSHSALDLPAELSKQKTFILDHIARSGSLIDVRPASRLELRPSPEMISTGIAEVDALVGGLPRGCLSEICGSGSSGKTSVLLATLAAATRREESCTLIDASDSFDPESGSAAGINFTRLLWVRCGNNSRRDRKLKVDDFFAYNRQPKAHHHFAIKIRNERRLEHVIKTADLVLQNGGFGLVAVDLAGIPEKFVRRIPLASWFRFQRAVEHTKTALLVMSEFPSAQTCATLVLKLSAIRPSSSATPFHAQIPGYRNCPTLVAGFATPRFACQFTHAQLLPGMQIEAELARNRLQRKPTGAVKANFATQAVRAG